MMAVMPETTERTEPSTTAGEREQLEGWLDYHRATLAIKCQGLSEEQLREAAVAPSELTLLGLVRHMAEVERHWFRNTFGGAGDDGIWIHDGDRDAEFHDLERADTTEAFDAWRTEIDHARALVRDRPLDDTGTLRRTGEPVSLRWILHHMIEEYARHNGHADLLRERIDGSTGD